MQSEHIQSQSITFMALRHDVSITHKASISCLSKRGIIIFSPRKMTHFCHSSELCNRLSVFVYACACSLPTTPHPPPPHPHHHTTPLLKKDLAVSGQLSLESCLLLQQNPHILLCSLVALVSLMFRRSPGIAESCSLHICIFCILHSGCVQSLIVWAGYTTSNSLQLSSS